MKEGLSTEEKQQIAEAPEHEVQGTILPPTPVSASAPVPKPRNHNRTAQSTQKPKYPFTTEEASQIATMSAGGWSEARIAKTIGRSRNAVKRHLDKPEVIAEVRNEQQELVEIYRDRARACVVAIDDDKIAKASALQLATSSGILLDKSLLLSGKPTQNVAIIMEVLDVLRQQRDEEDERQYQEAKARLSLPANQA